MGKQLTLDDKIFRQKKYQKRKKCSWISCPKICFPGSKQCNFHSIEIVLNYHYGLYDFIIPKQYGITAHEYFKMSRRKQFELDKLELLKIFPNGKLF